MNKLTSPVLLVGIPEHQADLRYAAPFDCPDPVVYLLQGRRSHLVVGSMEAARARRVMPLDCRIWTPGELAAGGRRMHSLEECCAALLRRLSVRAVKVAGDFPLGMARRLERDGCRMTVVRGGLFPARALKRPDELRRLRQSQRAAARAMDRAVRTLRAARVDQRGRLCDDRGLLTSERLRHVIQETLMAHNCEGPGTIAAGGRQAADPHEAGHGPLRAGEGIVLDIFPHHLGHGYWGDLSRTVVKGPPGTVLRRMYRAVRAAQRLALTHIRAGVSTRKIYRMVTDYFTAAGFPTSMEPGKVEGFVHSVGHGLGLEVHEAPRVGLSGERLRAGQVITVEPGLYYRAEGGVRVEDAVLVTATGYEIIYPARHVFQV